MIKTKKQIVELFYYNQSQMFVRIMYKKHYRKMCNAELIRIFNVHFPNLKIEFISNNRFLLLQKTKKEFEDQRFLKSEKQVIEAFIPYANRLLKNYLKTIKNKAIY